MGHRVIIQAPVLSLKEVECNLFLSLITPSWIFFIDLSSKILIFSFVFSNLLLVTPSSFFDLEIPFLWLSFISLLCLYLLINPVVHL